MNRMETSYAFCRGVVRRRAHNFYYGFRLLPEQRRNAICAVYAFMRYCDDLSDGDHGRVTPATMDRWRDDLDAALRGEYRGNPCWPALHDTVQRYAIPAAYLHEMIDGVSTDLQPRDIATFDELYRYCYQVASVAGLSLIHICEYTTPEALPLAEKCGIAFQLTNIIRDVKEDRERGRCYLPREDRERFPVMRDLLAFEAERAKRYYEEAAPLAGMIARDARPALRGLVAIYRTLLDRIEQSGYDVMDRRIELSLREKLWAVAKAVRS